jgi:hypothetical protein
MIDDLDVKGMPVTPPETDPPLLVDPDAVLALSITLQSRFELRIERSFRSPAAFSCCSFISTPLLYVARKPLGVLT